jgi:hypothetical protein
MAKGEKHHVFSARTTEEGLKALSELKARLGVSWDALVIDAVCAHYGLDRGVMAIPPRPKPEKEAEKKAEKKAERAKKAETKETEKVDKAKEAEPEGKR